MTKADIGERQVSREQILYESRFLSRGLNLVGGNTVEKETLTDFCRRLYPNVNWAIDLIGKNLYSIFPEIPEEQLNI